MLIGDVPFKASNMEDLQKLILKANINIEGKVSPLAYDLIKGLIKIKPEERLSIPEILNHEWLKQEDESNEEYNYFIMKNEKCEEYSPSINNIYIENLFFPKKANQKLLYKDYALISN